MENTDLSVPLLTETPQGSTSNQLTEITTQSHDVTSLEQQTSNMHPPSQDQTHDQIQVQTQNQAQDQTHDQIQVQTQNQTQDQTREDDHISLSTVLIVNLCANMIGAGMLSLPVCVAVLGPFVGIALMMVFALMAWATIMLLMRNGDDTYAGFMEVAFGIKGRVFLQLTIIMHITCKLISHVTIIVGSIDAIFTESWIEPKYGHFLHIATYCVLVPLAFVQHRDWVSQASLASAFIFLVALGVIAATHHHPKVLTNPTSLDANWMTMISALVTSYVCHFGVHGLRSRLQNPSWMNLVVPITLFICLFFHGFASLLSSLVFDKSIYDESLGLFRFAYVLHMLLAFPSIFHAFRLNVDALVSFPCLATYISTNLKQIATTICLLTILILGVNLVPKFSNTFQILRVFAALCIGFFLPSLITLRNFCGMVAWTLQEVMVLVGSVIIFFVAFVAFIFTLRSIYLT